MSGEKVELPPILSERFEAIEELGKGRMSTVVRARERSSGREVALKILHDHLVSREPVRRRLRRELAAVRRIDHPAVVRVDDLIEEEDLVALVMEFIDGQSVRRRVERDGPLDWSRARPVVEDVLAGLGAAHKQGILHRDLNAEHVMIDSEGRGRIVGFGMARVDELVGLTMHTRVLGALEAMAPERVLGMDYDGRADLYSVGAVVHEMLLGHPPVDGTMQAAFARAAAAGESIDLESAELPVEARYVLERSLVGDMSARFATAEQMKRALDGNYDVAMWSSWAGREAESCPGCQAPVIDGLAECLECGYEFRRLIQDPRGGPWVVQIVSRYDNFVKDVAFEINTEPNYLTEDQTYELMDLLNQFEDTRHLADGAPEYRYPPYILFDGLAEEDAKRIGELLKERGVLHRIADLNSGRLTETPLVTRNNFRHVQDFGKANDPILSPTMADVLRGVVGLMVGGFFTFALFVGQVPMAVTAVTMICFVGTLFFVRSQVRPGELVRIEAERQDRRVSSYGSSRRSVAELLPRGTGAVLRSLDDEAIRREIYELIVLALGLRQRLDESASSRVDELIGDMLDVVVGVQKHRALIDEVEVSQVLDELEQLQAKWAEAREDSARDELELQRQELLHRLEARDEAVQELTTGKARLLKARGALLDLRGVADEGESGAVDNRARQTLDEVQVVLQAAREVEELVGEGAI